MFGVTPKLKLIFLFALCLAGSIYARPDPIRSVIVIEPLEFFAARASQFARSCQLRFIRLLGGDQAPCPGLVAVPSSLKIVESDNPQWKPVETPAEFRVELEFPELADPTTEADWNSFSYGLDWSNLDAPQFMQLQFAFQFSAVMADYLVLAGKIAADSYKVEPLIEVDGRRDWIREGLRIASGRPPSGILLRPAGEEAKANARAMQILNRINKSSIDRKNRFIRFIDLYLSRVEILDSPAVPFLHPMQFAAWANLMEVLFPTGE